ncbi:MAG: sensor histidine kinase [Phycisphaerales bacterium]
MSARPFDQSCPGPRRARPHQAAPLAVELRERLDAALRLLDAARPHPLDANRAQSWNAIHDALVGMLELVEPASTEFARDLATRPSQSWTMAQTLRRLVDTFRECAEEAGVVVRLECESDAGALPAGPLEPLLANALHNAIDSCVGLRSIDASIVTVSLRRRGARLIIDVVDNGRGVGATAHDASGHGLGIDAARRIAHGLGGTVEVSNIPFGHGAIFRAEIPTARLSMREAA